MKLPTLLFTTGRWDQLPAMAGGRRSSFNAVSDVGGAVRRGVTGG